MPPKHRQLHAPCPKPAGNAYQSLVDLPEDGSDPTFYGRDGKVDGTDDNTVVIANPRDSGPPASQQLQHNEWVEDNIVLLGKQINFNGDDTAKRFIAMDNRLLGIKAEQIRHFDALNDKIDTLLQKMDTTWTENTALREAYRASREETAALKAAVDALTKRIDENITIPAPPSPDLTASSTTMEEMTMQLSVVQHDIQDVLEAVRNPPGKRK
jgi:regulator of replication initiation timing